jgi:hypothetical protein
MSLASPPAGAPVQRRLKMLIGCRIVLKRVSMRRELMTNASGVAAALSSVPVEAG